MTSMDIPKIDMTQEMPKGDKLCGIFVKQYKEGIVTLAVLKHSNKDEFVKIVCPAHLRHILSKIKPNTYVEIEYHGLEYVSKSDSYCNRFGVWTEKPTIINKIKEQINLVIKLVRERLK